MAEEEKEIKLPKAWLTVFSRLKRESNPNKRLTLLTQEGLRLTKERTRLNAESAMLGKQIEAISDFMVDNFEAGMLTEVKTKEGRAKLSPKIVPQMAKELGGWDAIYKFIKEQDAFDILQKRLHEAGCKARWESGVEIPGVKQFIKKRIVFGDE